MVKLPDTLAFSASSGGACGDHAKGSSLTVNFSVQIPVNDFVEVFAPEIRSAAQEAIKDLSLSTESASEREWIEVSDVASHLNVSEETVRTGARNGTIPGHKYLGKWFFSRSEIDESIKNPKKKAGRKANPDMGIWDG